MKCVWIFVCLLFAVNGWDLDVSIASNPKNYTELDTLNSTVYQSFVPSTSRIAEIALWVAFGGDLTITIGSSIGILYEFIGRDCRSNGHFHVSNYKCILEQYRKENICISYPCEWYSSFR